MRRISVVVFGLLTCVTTARAEDQGGFTRLESTTYVGAGPLLGSAKTNDFKNRNSGFGFSAMAGWRMHTYFGVEGSYEQWGMGKTIAAGITNKATFRTFGIDAYGYYPIGSHGWFQPFITVGVGFTGIKARQIHIYQTPVLDAVGNPQLNSDGTKQEQGHRDIAAILNGDTTHLRAGAGLELLLTNFMAARFTGRYQKFSGAYKPGTTVMASLLVKI
jgi:opacity protein-like surface antigen